MLRIAQAGKAESFCVDGDIKRIAGSVSESTVAYLKAHIADSQYTTTHLESLTKDQKDEITAILQEWLKTSEDSRSSRKKLGVKTTPDQIWNFVFDLQPEAVTTCFGRIEPLLKEKRYQQVVDSCSAILRHYPNETAPILLQRALAYTMLGGREKEAIADYVRAFIKDKDATIQVTRSKHGQYLPQITQLLRNCVFSTQPPGSQDSKVVKQWYQLTIDCCRLLLTLDPNNFKLQMTYASRLQAAQKTDKAFAVLNEALGVLKLDLEPDPFKVTEAWLRRGACALAKQQTEQAVTDVCQGLNAVSDAVVSANRRNDSDDDGGVTRTFLRPSDDIKNSESLAREIFADPAGDLVEIQTLLEKAAAKLNPANKFTGVVKIESVRQAVELYRAVLVIKPKDRETLIKLAGCYSMLGRHKCSINIYDHLLQDKNFAPDSILSARAVCYRELGNKAEARKDYDALLRSNPQDAALLFERSLVHMENNDILSLVTDLQAALKSNQRTVTSCLNKLTLALRTRIRQILFDHAKALLQDAPMPEIGKKNKQEIDVGSAGSVALEIAQVLTKINSADNAAHIIKAHALFFIGSFNDAETCLKRLLQETPQNPDTHIIKLHLGLLRIFTRHTDEGMTSMVEVLTNKGERAVLALLREIPSSERDKLSDECHTYAIDLLQKRRDFNVVRQAAHCFTIAILCCRGTDVAIEGLNTASNVCRSYLARAECMAHLGDQKSAVLDFSSALEVNPSCVEALCGRSFMRLALGEEHESVEDIVAACDLDIYTVTAHINVLPDEAKKLLLFWLDHRVVALLLNYGYKASNNNRTSTGGSASTISVMDETALKPGHESTPNSSLSSIQVPTPPNSTEHERNKEKAAEKKHAAQSANVKNESLNSNNNREDITPHPGIQNGAGTPVVVEVYTDPVQEDGDKNRQLNDGNRTDEDVEAAQTKRKFHKSSASTRNLKDALLSMDKAKGDENGANKKEKPFKDGSRGSTAMTTTSSLFTYDDVFTGMEKAEILHKAQLLGRLLINVDPSNATWHGMFADILIVKGDFDEALRHLQVVMELMPTDVTAIARAGLINVKQNRYKLAARLLSVLAEVDKNGLLYVLRALDSSKRERLGEEALKQADELVSDEKFDKAAEYCGLSLFAHEGKRIEKLRMRARCFVKIRENKRAIEDMSLVVRDTAKNVKAGDYCMRAHMYLQDNREGEACLDYIKALKIDRDQAALQIHSKPGRGCVARVFYRQALEEFSHHQYQDCFDMCEYGLMVEDGIDLRKLRARAKREISKCTIQ